MDPASSHPKRRSRTRPLRALQTTLGAAILLATLFTALPSQGLISGNVYERLEVLLTPQQVDTIFTPQPQIHIGIVAGHSGNDSGAVCTDGNGNVTLTEAEVNLEIAALVPAHRNKTSALDGFVSNRVFSGKDSRWGWEIFLKQLGSLTQIRRGSAVRLSHFSYKTRSNLGTNLARVGLGLVS